MAQQQRIAHQRIVQDPAIMAGKPVVKGTRIPVERVLRHLAENPDLNDLFAAFPQISADDVKACLEYACLQLEQGHASHRKRFAAGA